jgi:hypothetical protein
MENNEPIEVTEKQEEAPLKEEENKEEENPDESVENKPPKRIWLTPAVKKILVGAGGAAISVFQLLAIITFFTYFFGISGA